MNINSVVRMHSIELYLDTHWMDEQKAVFRWIKTYGGWVKQLEANKFISSVCFQLFSKYRCRTCACVDFCGFLDITTHQEAISLKLLALKTDFALLKISTDL